IIIAMPSAPRSAVREIVAICRETGAALKILPGIYQLIDGQVSVNALRDVAIEDLLGRPPVAVDLTEVASYLQGETVLVTGAGGTIGAELCRQIAGFGPAELLLLGRGEHSIYQIHLELTGAGMGDWHGVTTRESRVPSYETPAASAGVVPRATSGERRAAKIIPVIADVRDRERLRQVFDAYRPAVVFHAAAHKHVPLMEDAPDEAIKNNVFGTKNVAELADEFGAKSFVLVSTDKAVRPASVMGATKRLAEMVVQDLAARSRTRFCAVRFGNVLGSRGSVIPLFQRQIAAGGPVTVTDPGMVRFFMTAQEAVNLMIQAGAMGKGGEIFVLDMGEPVRILDLARDLIRLSGLEPGKDVEIVFTGPRPGEKLYEEVLMAEEGVTATRHERIFIAKPGAAVTANLGSDLQKLAQVLAEPAACVQQLETLVPSLAADGRCEGRSGRA
ncbi:MAG: polysaccharide biosynthesis protein, partial [Bacteroidota bacterium]